MLVDFKQPLKEGERVVVTLSLRRGDRTTEVEVDAPVCAAGGSAHRQH